MWIFQILEESLQLHKNEEQLKPLSGHRFNPQTEHWGTPILQLFCCHTEVKLYANKMCFIWVFGCLWPFSRAWSNQAAPPELGGWKMGQKNLQEQRAAPISRSAVSEWIQIKASPTPPQICSQQRGKPTQGSPGSLPAAPTFGITSAASEITQRTR